MSARVPGLDTAVRMHATAAALAAAGMDATVHDTRGVLDITASLGQPGSKSIEVIVDDDGYAEIRYWNAPGATPAQICAVITAALAVISGAQPGEPGPRGSKPRPVTGQANSRPRPGLGGTGRVGDDLYLMTHHEVTGRAHLQPRAVGLGLAGALLAELVLAGATTVDAGTVTCAWPGLAADPLTAAVAGQIAAENPQHPVADWLAFLARTAPGDVAARLAQAGYLAPAPRRPWQAARWRPVDPDCAFAPVARLNAALSPSRPGDVQAIALAGLAAACGLGPRLGLYLPPGARARTGALVPLLGPGLHQVITQTQAAVDAALLAHRI